MFNYRLLRFLSLAGLLMGLSCSSPLDPPTAANTGDSPPPPAAALSAGGEVPPSGTGDPEEIKAIMAQIAAARQDIRSYRMHIKWQTRRFAETPVNGPLPGGVVVYEGEGVWIEEGEKWRVHHSRRNERTDLMLNRDLPLDTPPRPGFPDGDFQHWAAFDGDEYAMRSTQAGADFLMYYPGPVVKTGEQVQVGADLYPFPLKWGFGSGEKYIDDFYHETLSRVKVRPIWDIERLEAEGEPRIQMTVYQTKKGRSGHALELIVDPERDFQLVHVLAWESSGGKLLEEQQRTLQQLADGRWFPLKICVRHKDEYTEREFSDVEFNVSLDPSIFSFHSFESGHSTIMQRRNLDGTDTAFLLRGDQWVPASMVPVSDRPRNMRSPKGGHPVVLNK